MTDTEQRIRKIIAQHMNFVDDASIKVDSDWDSLSMDSLDTIELVMAVEEEFGIEIPDEDAQDVANFGQLVAYVEKRR